jgi:hypothetical protein
MFEQGLANCMVTRTESKNRDSSNPVSNMQIISIDRMTQGYRYSRVHARSPCKL